MTDWNSNDSVDVVDMMRGGMDWITPGSADDTFTRPLREAIETGRLPLGELRESAEHLVRTVAELVSMRAARHLEDPDMRNTTSSRTPVEPVTAMGWGRS